MPGSAVVEQGVEQRQGLDSFLTGGGQMRGEHRGQRPAQAQPHDVGLLRAGDVGHDVERGAQPVVEVVLERDAAHRRPGVAPGDREHRALVLDRPLQEAAPGGQVHDVVLVDPRRAGQQRDRVHLLGLRRVLDQLHELVPEHDLALGGGQVLAERERTPVHLLRAALVVGQVVGEVARSGQHARAARLERPLERGRVGEQVVRRGKRVPEQAADEPGLAVRHGIGLPRREQFLAVLPGSQVALAQREEGRVLFPGWVGEPAVLRVRRHRRLARLAQPAGEGRRADLRQVRPEPDTGRGERGRLHGRTREHGGRRAEEVPHVQAAGGQARLRAAAVLATAVLATALVVVVRAHPHTPPQFWFSGALASPVRAGQAGRSESFEDGGDTLPAADAHRDQA